MAARQPSAVRKKTPRTNSALKISQPRRLFRARREIPGRGAGAMIDRVSLFRFNGSMLLLFDIGNTHTHLGLANDKQIVKQTNISTLKWIDGTAPALVKRFAGRSRIDGAMLCSVVPRATPSARQMARSAWDLELIELNAKTARGVGIDYPTPKTIGADRLANALAAFKRFGAPVVVVDFGTAVTFDVVDPAGNYAGGIIAPGLAAMTDYLHEKTALLPRIRIVEPKRIIGKSTKQAMLAGAVFGYRGLVRELIHQLKREMHARRLPVVATGGYAGLMAAGLPDISAVEPNLTLEGLRLAWNECRRDQKNSRQFA